MNTRVFWESDGSFAISTHSISELDVGINERGILPLCISSSYRGGTPNSTAFEIMYSEKNEIFPSAGRSIWLSFFMATRNVTISPAKISQVLTRLSENDISIGTSPSANVVSGITWNRAVATRKIVVISERNLLLERKREGGDRERVSGIHIGIHTMCIG